MTGVTEGILRLMVVGAHAFDAEAMAGGLAARVRAEGGAVLLVHLTRGERGAPARPPEQYAVQLEEEMQQAARILGARAYWPGYPAGDLPEEAVVAELSRLLAGFGPHVVVTHWRGSWHPRHVAAHRLTLKAVQHAGRTGDPGPEQAPAVYFGENCEDLVGFVPSLYVDISTVFSQWHKALRCYEMFRRSEPLESYASGIPYAGFYPAMARVRGLEAGCTYAQAFMPAHPTDPGGRPMRIAPGEMRGYRWVRGTG